MDIYDKFEKDPSAKNLDEILKITKAKAFKSVANAFEKSPRIAVDYLKLVGINHNADDIISNKTSAIDMETYIMKEEFIRKFKEEEGIKDANDLFDKWKQGKISRHYLKDCLQLYELKDKATVLEKLEKLEELNGLTINF